MVFFPRWKEEFNFQPLFDPTSVKRDGAKFSFDLLLMGDEFDQLRAIVNSGQIPCSVYCDGMEYQVSLFKAGEQSHHYRMPCYLEVIE